MTNDSRRNFIRGMSLAGVAVYGMPQMVAIASETGTGQKLKDGAVILFQGDSITDGNRGRNADPNHIMGHGYAFSIASRIGADFPEKNYQFFNRGISGNKVIDMVGRWQQDTLDLNPDVLSILVGINDSSSIVFHRDTVVTVENYEKTYNLLLEQILAKFPNIIFVLCEPFILPVGRVKDNWDTYHADIVQRQTIVRKLAAKYNAVFVGFQEIFDQACKRATADYWIWDGIHPTVAGHELMVREWLKQVKIRIEF